MTSSTSSWKHHSWIFLDSTYIYIYIYNSFWIISEEISRLQESARSSCGRLARLAFGIWGYHEKQFEPKCLTNLKHKLIRGMIFICCQAWRYQRSAACTLYRVDNIWPIWPHVFPFWPWKCVSFFSWFWHHFPIKCICSYSHVTANAPNPPWQSSVHDGTRAGHRDLLQVQTPPKPQQHLATSGVAASPHRAFRFTPNHTAQLITGKTSRVS